mgnify:CR=1 FL=1
MTYERLTFIPESLNKKYFKNKTFTASILCFDIIKSNVYYSVSLDMKSQDWKLIRCVNILAGLMATTTNTGAALKGEKLNDVLMVI